MFGRYAQPGLGLLDLEHPLYAELVRAVDGKTKTYAILYRTSNYSLLGRCRSPWSRLLDGTELDIV